MRYLTGKKVEMGRNRVRFEKDGEEWAASLENHPEIRATARKKDEAVGRLYMQFAHRIDIVVDGQQALSACYQCGKE